MNDETPDPLAILAALGMPELARVTPITGGADTLIWRVEHGDSVSALRVFRSDQTRTVRREVAALTAANAAGVPVPEIRAEGIWNGRPALLLTWMPGLPLRDELRARPWRAWALGVQFGRMQAFIHTVSPPVAFGSDPMAWIAWADPDDALRDCLLAAARGPAVLLHLDYHPMNVLVDGGRVSAVLDWANAGTGDARADLARTASLLRIVPLDLAWPKPLIPIVRRALGAGWRHGYRQVAGPMPGMAPFYAWAAAVMIRDLGPRLGRPELPWLTADLLEDVRQWGECWLRGRSESG